MKTALNLIITCLVVIMAWQVETGAIADEPNLTWVIIIPFLVVTIYARLNIKELKL